MKYFWLSALTFAYGIFIETNAVIQLDGNSDAGSDDISQKDANHYLLVDVDAGQAHDSANEVKRTQRSFWKKLWKHTGLTDLFCDNDDCVNCCNNLNSYSAGDGDGDGDTYNGQSPVYNPYFQPLSQSPPPSLPLHPLRVLQPFFRPFGFEGMYGGYRIGSGRSSYKEESESGNYDSNKSSGYAAGSNEVSGDVYSGNNSQNRKEYDDVVNSSNNGSNFGQEINSKSNESDENMTRDGENSDCEANADVYGDNNPCPNEGDDSNNIQSERNISNINTKEYNEECAKSEERYKEYGMEKLNTDTYNDREKIVNNDANWNDYNNINSEKGYNDDNLAGMKYDSGSLLSNQSNVLSYVEPKAPPIEAYSTYDELPKTSYSKDGGGGGGGGGFGGGGGGGGGNSIVYQPIIYVSTQYDPPKNRYSKPFAAYEGAISESIRSEESKEMEQPQIAEDNVLIYDQKRNNDRDEMQSYDSPYHEVILSGLYYTPTAFTSCNGCCGQLCCGLPCALPFKNNLNAYTTSSAAAVSNFPISTATESNIQPPVVNLLNKEPLTYSTPISDQSYLSPTQTLTYAPPLSTIAASYPMPPTYFPAPSGSSYPFGRSLAVSTSTASLLPSRMDPISTVYTIFAPTTADQAAYATSLPYITQKPIYGNGMPPSPMYYTI